MSGPGGGGQGERSPISPASLAAAKTLPAQSP